MCLETMYSILGYWNYPLTNIIGDSGCHIVNLLTLTGALETQLHSFIMATTRYILLFHDNLLLRFKLTTTVSAIWTLTLAIICLCLNFNIIELYDNSLHANNTLTLLGLGLIKINDVSADFNNPRPLSMSNN